MWIIQHGVLQHSQPAGATGFLETSGLHSRVPDLGPATLQSWAMRHFIQTRMMTTRSNLRRSKEHKPHPPVCISVAGNTAVRWGR